MAWAARNWARTSVRVRGPETTCRETNCHAPKEIEALNGSMKATGGQVFAPRTDPRREAGLLLLSGDGQSVDAGSSCSDIRPDRPPGTYRPRSAGYLLRAMATVKFQGRSSS